MATDRSGLYQGRDKKGRRRWLRRKVMGPVVADNRRFRQGKPSVRGTLKSEGKQFGSFLKENYGFSAKRTPPGNGLARRGQRTRPGVRATVGNAGRRVKNAATMDNISNNMGRIQVGLAGANAVGAIKRANDRRTGKRKGKKGEGLGTELGVIGGGLAGGIAGDYAAGRLRKSKKVRGLINKMEGKKGTGIKKYKAPGSALRKKTRVDKMADVVRGIAAKTRKPKGTAIKAAPKVGTKLAKMGLRGKINPRAAAGLGAAMLIGTAGSMIGERVGKKIGGKLDRRAGEKRRAANARRAKQRAIAR